MAQPACGTFPVNSFAVVSYIPGPLGDFLTGLRKDLVPGCIARSHVSILPPRPVIVPVREAEHCFREMVQEFSSFHLEMPGIGTFEETLVIFLEIGRGSDEIHAMHRRMNRGPLVFEEPYPFYPHVTLAQGLSRHAFDEVHREASRRWKDAGLDSTVLIENATFVRNTLANSWIDLVECPLQPLPRLRPPNPA